MRPGCGTADARPDSGSGRELDALGFPFHHGQVVLRCFRGELRPRATGHGNQFVAPEVVTGHHLDVGEARSLRARERPTVSTPLQWDEVRAALDSGDPDALAFDATQVLDRVGSRGDLFAPLLSVVQALPS